ncbi:Fur family transcriptional regulator [Syntrophus aciditrophicus]|uniref:Ferric uptake regulatory protein n=1 Tax=Syntrophus aciditrophicus (strain SB) TaxID=56780 RepID=Q2LXF1_SYNAS|nr:transcriptional repressor [Syntrophus aciditrophicus]ABC78759.1 ferric uptake regulatory protein [Syntrophus aciditrophicus SB]OPY13651.1 MAG: Peroxide-responsive repressor PerR [Syntrophus sp. PtaB.Bin075]
MDPLEEKIAAFETACRKAGLKVTRQRREIYRELLLSTDHPSAEALHQRLRGILPGISLDTVYRTLATLASAGLIKKVETSESLSRFEATFSRHHHLICRQCGQIQDFTWSFLDEVSLPDEIGDWGRIDSKNVVVYGICSTCLNQTHKKNF